MARRVFARFVDEPGGRIDVLLPGGAAPVITELGEATLRSGDDVVLFVPGTEVTCLSVALPARNEREARRAARFAIEDDVASPVEELHVALSAKQGDDARQLWVCHEALMEAWTGRLMAAGVDDVQIVPEFAVLPPEDVALDAGERLLLRVNGQPMALDSTVPDDLLRAVASSGETPLSIYGNHLAARLGLHPAGDVAIHPLQTLADLYSANEPAMDLRQGQFAKRTSLSLPDFGKWQVPAAIAASAALIWLGYINLETRSLNRASEILRAEAQARYTAVYSDEGRVTNPAARVQDKLGSRGPGALDFEATAAVLYASIQSVEGASLRTLRFDREQGLIRVSVEYGAYGDDLQLAEALSASGLRAELGDTRNAGNRITGELTLGSGA